MILGGLGLLWRGSLGAHLIARAIWLQAATLGALMLAVALSGSSVSTEGLIASTMLVGGGGLALVALGRVGLDQSSDLFAPSAYRTSLLLSLVMAAADTQALLLYAGVELGDRYGASFGEAAVFLVAAAVIALAVYGLYRMRIWGLALNLVANVCIAGMALGGALELPDVLAWGLAATAITQLLIPAPLVREMVRAARAHRG